MNQDNLSQLQQISTPKAFKKDEYICYEGQPGNEMYIILKGTIGIFVTSPMGTLTEVANIKQGNFFGEMAIFDNLPRSASCIAKEDTVCVAVNKEKLIPFFANCPDMAAKLVENMSSRIRKLNNEVYKNTHYIQNQHVQRFRVPVDYSSHAIKEPYHEPDYVNEYKQACPICQKAISIVNVKRNILEKKNVDIDGRITYLACEPMWLDIVSCPYCYYTNHYLNFFKVIEANYDKTKTLLKEQHIPVVENNTMLKSDLDGLVLKYLQAININENFNSSDCILLGGMWMNLYWLGKDAKDDRFTKYAAVHAARYYKEAVDDNKILGKTDMCSVALTVATLFGYLGYADTAMKYCNIALECQDEDVLHRAMKFKKTLKNNNFI